MLLNRHLDHKYHEQTYRIKKNVNVNWHNKYGTLGKSKTHKKKMIKYVKLLTFYKWCIEPSLYGHVHDMPVDIKDKNILCFFVDNKNHRQYNGNAT